MRALRLILGDQLSDTLSALEGCDTSQDIILMCEVMEEATYVQHHQKKIAFLFSAMRHFAQSLMEQGHHVRYVKLDDTNNTGSLIGEIKRAVTDLGRIPRACFFSIAGSYTGHSC
jgi:deoxyribodipyrimidine photolyase-related protein